MKRLKDLPGDEIASIFAPAASLEPRQRRYWRRYLEVLSAAAQQFSEKGYHAATTKSIAEALGVQQGSLYYYIKSKEAALEQICQVAIDGYVRFALRIRNSRKPAAEKIKELVLLHLRTLDERPDFFRVFLRHRQDMSPTARQAVGKQIREYERHVEAIFRQGVRSGEFRPDLDTLHATLALLGMCNAVPSWWMVRSSADIQQIASEFAAIVVSGVIAPEARSAANPAHDQDRVKGLTQ